MIGFQITENLDNVEFITCYLIDEGNNGQMEVDYYLNQENMTRLRNQLHNELLDADRIMREKGWE